jgi:uncharacterized membrane protein HdeD (DUF308 family)
MEGNPLITNIYLRLLFGFWCITIGLVSLKLYFSKHKNNKWGMLHKRSFEIKNQKKTKINSDRIIIFLQERMALISGWFLIIAGIIAIFFGFRKGIGY